MLVGQRLFAAENEFQTLRNVLTMPVPPPSSRRREVPAALDAIVARALEREREARFSSADAMADALAGALAAARAPVAQAALDPDDGVRRLMAELFGEGAPPLPERTTSTFSAGTFSSLEPEAPAPPAPPPERESLMRRRVVPIAVGLVLGAGIAWAVLQRMNGP
jgi:hypothetical protein